MSLGLMLLRSILDAGAQTTLRQTMPVWFTDEERAVYDYLSAHVSRHGRLPSLETLSADGIGLPRAPEPVEHYLERVRERAVYTQLQALFPEMAEFVKRRDMSGALATLRQMLSNAQAVNPAQDITTLHAEGLNVIRDYREAHRSFSLLGVPLGWDCVDEVTGGGQPGDVIVVVGRPNTGKTYGLLWMVKRAWNEGRSILFCSMEMDAPQITRRVIGIQSGLNPNGIRSGRLSSWGEDMLHSTVDAFDDMPPFNIITGNFRKRVSDINRAAEEHQPDIIVVDAGYLVSSDKQNAHRTRREQIADVIEELKMVAQDRRRPLLTSVQFNREVKRVHRGDMDLANIGETDAIGQVASIVMGLRYGDTPYEVTRRRWELLKNREGRLIRWETNLGFAPVDLSFTRFIVDDAEENARAAPDLRHMM